MTVNWKQRRKGLYWLKNNIIQTFALRLTFKSMELSKMKLSYSILSIVTTTVIIRMYTVPVLSMCALVATRASCSMKASWHAKRYTNDMKRCHG